MATTGGLITIGALRPNTATGVYTALTVGVARLNEYRRIDAEKTNKFSETLCGRLLFNIPEEHAGYRAIDVLN
ncbi:hypothetical protein [Paraburkholderia caribensis]|uniref:hypothetical protein n=1 Tax=Paraburkholderia caribensis TaxID=75105 RepID=UPI0011DF8B1C|nr:hypothetical protein [Paraburkholderia caribensis]